MKKTAFIFTDTFESEGMVVEIPVGISSKAELLDILGEELRFPDYYGRNWDALEECIRDLSWLLDHKIVVRHVDLPLMGDIASVKVYLAILDGAVQRWHSELRHQLLVTFPSQLQTEVESLINQE